MNWTMYHSLAIPVAVLVAFAIKKIFFSGPRMSKEEKALAHLAVTEQWQVYEPSISGVQWYLPRKKDWDNQALPSAETDSRPLLEKFGFKLLGIFNEKFYCFEPPLGWTKQHSGGAYTTYLMDEDGVIQLSFFHKNEYYEHRAHVYENKEKKKLKAVA